MGTPGRQVTNRDVAERLAFMARLLEIAGEDRYRIAAYERAARQVERLSFPVAGLDEEELTRIPGIGDRIAGQIHEIAATGTFRELQDLQATIPGSIVELLGVAGVGPGPCTPSTRGSVSSPSTTWSRRQKATGSGRFRGSARRRRRRSKRESGSSAGDRTR